MHQPHYLYRNVHAGELLELFMVSAVSSLLLTRFFLYLTGFPSLGGSTLHIAHMLWGGLLMMVAVIVLVAFIGIRMQRRASIVAGLGFGLFIDELGKFITRDNDYFFQPTIGLIYLIFVLLFILKRLLAQTQRLSQYEYLLNAVAMTEEVVIHDLDEAERNQALAYLKRADQNHPLVPALTRVLEQVKPVVPSKSWWNRWAERTQKVYERLVSRPGATMLFNSAYVLNSMVFLGVVLILLYNQLQQPLSVVSLFELVCVLVSPILTIGGLVHGRRNRLLRYRWFLLASLTNILVTQFFSFYHDQFSALPGFLVNLVFYIGIRSLIGHEERSQLIHREK